MLVGLFHSERQIIYIKMSKVLRLIIIIVCTLLILWNYQNVLIAKDHTNENTSSDENVENMDEESSLHSTYHLKRENSLIFQIWFVFLLIVNTYFMLTTGNEPGFQFRKVTKQQQQILLKQFMSKSKSSQQLQRRKQFQSSQKDQIYQEGNKNRIKNDINRGSNLCQKINCQSNQQEQGLFKEQGLFNNQNISYERGCIPTNDNVYENQNQHEDENDKENENENENKDDNNIRVDIISHTKNQLQLDNQLPSLKMQAIAQSGNSSTQILELYCKVCDCLQRPRMKHCYSCGKCIMKYDHHCPWIGSCVGQLNHFKFLLCLLCHTSQSFTTFYIFYQYHDSINDTFSTQFGIFIIWAIFMFLYLIFAGGLFLFHSYLIASNVTTRQLMSRRKCLYLKNIKGNPFDSGIIQNLKNAISPKKQGKQSFSQQIKLMEDQQRSENTIAKRMHENIQELVLLVLLKSKQNGRTLEKFKKKMLLMLAFFFKSKRHTLFNSNFVF